MIYSARGKKWNITFEEFTNLTHYLKDSSALLKLLLSSAQSQDLFEKCEVEFYELIVTLLKNTLRYEENSVIDIKAIKDNRICNKLLQLFGAQFSSDFAVKKVRAQALKLRDRIQYFYNGEVKGIYEESAGSKDKKLLEARKQHLLNRVKQVKTTRLPAAPLLEKVFPEYSLETKNQTPDDAPSTDLAPKLEAEGSVSQRTAVELPGWFPGHALSRKVDTFVLIVLYMLGTEYSDELLSYYTALVERQDDPLHLGDLREMTYGKLLARVYIKIAKILKPTLQKQLELLFPRAKVLMAPIKDVTRTLVKMAELGREGKSSPLATHILDYLRASILCKTIDETVDALKTLSEAFEVVRFKDRIIEDSMPGNKCFLVNLIVEAPRELYPELESHAMFKPSWKALRMVCEVQITVEKMFYLDKQMRNAYEIARCSSNLDWSSSLEPDPSSRESEEANFPDGLLYGNPKFAF